MRLFNHFFLALLLILALKVTDSLSSGLEFYGTTGKITGIVKDDKGELLIGARVEIEGTQFRSGTDESGQYAILNVPVGTYSVKCSYVGFESQIQQDVKVSADVTSEINFTMTQGGVVLDTTVIIAKRKTVDNGSGKIINSQTIDEGGIRGIENIVAKTSGIVQDEKGQNINIRGGRDGETQIIIDGIVTNNPLDRTSTANVSNGALQELAVLTGGFSAEYGNVLSGVINVTTKSATTKFSGAVDMVSDFIAGKRSQGYNIYSVSLGGPVIPTKKLAKYWSVFGNFERQYFLVDQPVSTDVAKLWSEDGILPNFSRDGYSWTGKTIISIDEMTKGKIKINLTAGYSGNIERSRQWVGSFGLFNSYMNPKIRDENQQGFFKINQLFGSKTFYDLQASYLRSTSTGSPGLFSMDESYKGLTNGWTYPWYLAIGDTNVIPGLSGNGSSISNNVNYGVFRNPYDLAGISAFSGNIFGKRKTDQLAFNLNFTHQVLTKKFGNHELKFGGEYKQYKIRMYDVNPLSYSTINYNKYSDSSGFVVSTPVISDDDGNAAFLNAFGYDPFGVESDVDYLDAQGNNVTEGPLKPRVGAFYFLDKMEFSYFNTNIGVRVDYLDPNTTVPIDYRNLKGSDGQFTFADYKKVEKTIIVSPRLGFSFPITDKTVFHAQYGKFVQLPALENLYTNQRVLRDLADGGVGYFTIFNNPLLKPEKTTAYELGVKHTAGEYLTLGLTAYYKETSDLIQARNIKAYDLSYGFAIYDNGDFGIIRGLDFSLDLRRINRLRASVSYGLAFASGTGSDINTLSNVAYNGDEPPKLPNALDYDQRHTGAVELDYRWGTEDVPKGFWGGVLSRLGINVLFSFNSGRPYTPQNNATDPLAVVSGLQGNQPIAPINSAYYPWNYKLDLKIDKSVKIFDKLNANIYLLVLNALDQELINAVFEGSGEPGYTGWLDSFPGKQWAQQNGPEAVRLYNIRSHAINNYGPPRQVRLGLRLFFN
ncbi:MAG: TonB-dependent receptor [Ignavibacteria bacterium]|nr:TonB-dependent receptor [Ignavibacteria bacterium]